jgi:hypothetical protein
MHYLCLSASEGLPDGGGAMHWATHWRFRFLFCDAWAAIIEVMQ